MDRKTVLAAALAASAATAVAGPTPVDARATIATGPKPAASAPRVECKVNPETGRNLTTLQGGLSRLSVADVAKARPCVVVAPASAPTLELKK